MGYFIILVCIAIAGTACSSATKETSNSKTEGSATTATPATTTAAATPATAATIPPPASTPASETTPTSQEVKVYLVAVGDKGKKGKKIGCDDSLIPITRTIKTAGEPLRATIEELLAVPHEYSKELGNYWWGKNLKVKSVAIADGVATINISGEGPFVAGVCDEPRITEQIEETARQFPAVKKVKVFVNNKTLAEAIR
jgi:spore germination protein GerM